MTLEWARFPLKVYNTNQKGKKKDNLNYNNTKNFCSSKDNIKKMKRQSIEEKVLATCRISYIQNI